MSGMESALARDMKRCRHCGSKDVGVYPIDSSKKTKKSHLDNLITLCPTCEGSRAKTFYPDIVGVLLCGGTGSRLAPLTITHNKHELPVGSIPMVMHPVKTLRNLGVKSVVVVLDRHNIGGMIEILGSGKEFGMDFHYRVQEGAGGIADALLLAKPLVKPGQGLCVILGDNVFDDDMPIDLTTTDPAAKAVVFLKEVSDPTEYGVATIENGKVTEIVEKPKSPKTNLAVTGLYFYTPEVFDIALQGTPSARDELEISDINDYYAKKGELAYQVVPGFWGDAGSSFSLYQSVCAHVIERQQRTKP